MIFRESVVPLRRTEGVSSTIGHVTFGLIVLTVAWFAIGFFRSSAEWASERLRAESEHEIRHRVLRTQLTLLRQLTTAVIVVVAIAAVLMQFAVVRAVDLSLLASAGLVGVVVGFAAQKPLAGLIGGIQLSITQPIRIGDTVFIEKELGTIERIHWTLAAPDVIGSVLLSVDFTTPVDAVRAELAAACAGHDAWEEDVFARSHGCDEAQHDTSGARLVVGCNEELGAPLFRP